jgi:hypothetical protein
VPLVALLPLAVFAPPAAIVVRHRHATPRCCHAACRPAAPHHPCAARLCAAPCHRRATHRRSPCCPLPMQSPPMAQFSTSRCCRPLPAAVMNLLSLLFITFPAPIDGLLLCSLHTQQHTD